MTGAGETGEVLEQTLRPSGMTRVRVDSVLTSALLSELLTPSKEIWLVSAWVSDVPALDNSCGQYDSLLEDAAARPYTLAEVLGILTHRGTRLRLVLRDRPENRPFQGRLAGAAAEGRWHVTHSTEVHEKTLCGYDWLVSGSMNFTMNGMRVNDEAVTYKVDPKAAGAARIDYERRWGAA